MPSILRHIQAHTDTHTPTHTHTHTHTQTNVCKWNTNSSPHTPWACTLTPVTTPVTCPDISLCAVLTHTSAYSTWPPVTYTTCEAQTWTCTIKGHAQLVQTVEVFRYLMAEKSAFTDFTLKLLSLHLYRLNMTQAEPQYWSEPEGFQRLQWEEDTAKRVLYTFTIKPNKLHSWCLLGILVFSFYSWIPICWFLVLLILLAFLGTTSAPDYKSFGDPTSG